ncbi:S8 family serine peptidase [Leptolyngbya sp. FACHB-17]|uniref:S8 family serine peptidase n=1 Tax=unclassified Leptolyngbya TaxID=2650499 RepID=UPI0018F049B0|nr:S8 family serine peptidase [Leptolyngbya sp. FACHB-17]
MERQEKRYSNQQSNATFQPQTYRQAGFEQVNAGRAETHSSSAPTSPGSQQPLVGVIDQGFGAGEHGTKVLKTIAESNPQSPAWLGGGVGNGNWANSLTKFVDAAKTLGKQAVANLSFDLTEKHPDGSVTTRSQLTTAEQQALNYARDNGVLIVASAGNQGSAMSALGQASQQFDNIIAVGAADGNHRADYSSYGNGLDLVAPGQQTGDAFTGTSRAAAEVTGTISRMWAANPTLDYR